MAAAVRLLDDFGGERLRALARGSKDGPQARRLLALAAIYDGAPGGEAAGIGDVTLQICEIGRCASMPMGLTGFLTARRRALRP